MGMMAGQWIGKIEKICLAMVLSTPLITFPHVFVPTEIVKTFWFFSWVEIWFWWRVLTFESYFLRLAESVKMPLLALWIWIAFVGVASAFLGGEAFWGGWWRRQGWWFFVHLGVLFFLTSTSSFSERFVRRLIMFFLAVTVVLGLVGVTANFRPSGTLGEANSWGLFAGLMSLVVLLISQRKFLLLFSLIALIASQSRSAILAFVLFAFPKVAPVSKMVMIFSAIVLVLWFQLGRGTGERLTVWRETFSIWKSSPWVGIGLDNFQSVFTLRMRPLGLNWPKFDQPHNLPLFVLVSTGSIGLGLYCGWLYLLFSVPGRKLWRQLAGLILVFSLFQPLLTPVWVYLFLLLGFSARKDSPPRIVRVAKSERVVASVLIVVLGVWIWWNLAWFMFGQYL